MLVTDILDAGLADPIFSRDPIPNTVDQVVDRIVEWVQHSVRSYGGPAYQFHLNPALFAFTDHWGTYIEEHLRTYTQTHGHNPWIDQWQNVARIAQLHGWYAVDIAKSKKHKPVSTDDFVCGGYKAAGVCHSRFGLMACWCNSCAS